MNLRVGPHDELVDFIKLFEYETNYVTISDVRTDRLHESVEVQRFNVRWRALGVSLHGVLLTRARVLALVRVSFQFRVRLGLVPRVRKNLPTLRTRGSGHLLTLPEKKVYPRPWAGGDDSRFGKHTSRMDRAGGRLGPGRPSGLDTAWMVYTRACHNTRPHKS